MATKWGIVSSGKICHDFVLCLQSLADHEIVAVAARDEENARKFAHEHSIPKYHQSYNALAQDPDIEIAYIGNLCIDHFRVSKMMLEAGKHVLCEKPFCVNVQQVDDLIAVAKKHKRFLMEGIWSRFFPLYKTLKEELARDSIGTANLIDVLFVFDGTAFERFASAKLGGSVVLEVGVYAVQLATLVFGAEKPLKITATGIVSSEGVDEVALITLEYSHERVAVITLSLRNQWYNQAAVAGTKGYLRFPCPFHAPTVLETETQKFESPLPKVEGKFNFQNSSGLVYEAMAVRECLIKGELESSLMPLEESKTILYILTEIRRQLGAAEY